MLFFRRSRQGLPDAAGQLAGCTGLVMVKHEQTRPVLIAEMLFAAGYDQQAALAFRAVLFGLTDNQCLVVAADAVRYGLVRLQLLQEGSELRRGKGNCFRLSLAHPAFRGIFDKLAVRQLHALGQVPAALLNRVKEMRSCFPPVFSVKLMLLNYRLSQLTNA